MKSIQETLKAFSIGEIKNKNWCLQILTLLDGKPFNQYQVYEIKNPDDFNTIDLSQGYSYKIFRNFYIPILQPICFASKNEKSSLRCYLPFGHLHNIHYHYKWIQYNENDFLFDITGRQQYTFYSENYTCQNKLFYDYNFHRFNVQSLYADSFVTKYPNSFDAYPLTALTKQNIFDYFIINRMKYYPDNDFIANHKLIYNIVPFLQDPNSPDPIKMSEECIKAWENETFFKTNKEYIKEFLP